MRTFISIHPDDETLHKISVVQKNFMENVRAIDEEKSRALKWESAGKLHITLFFIGETEKNITDEISKRLQEINADFGRLEICTGKIDAFPNLRFPRVVVLEMAEPEGKLAKLVGMIRNAMLEFGLREDKPFRPHITLARIRRDRKISLTGMNAEIGSPIRFTVTAFCLYQSILQPSGSVYKKLNEFAFSHATGKML